MAISRRTLVKAGAVAGLVAVTPLANASALFQGGDPDGIGGLRKATFDGLVGERFGVLTDTDKLLVDLVEVSELPPSRPGGECFSLVFRTDRPLRQGLYRLDHPSVGNAGLLLAPADEGGGRFYATAVINRLSRAA